MGFLQTQVSLAGTKFPQELLAKSQNFLVEVITRHDPGWLKNPEGPLGAYWIREDVTGVCFLINFADTFGTLQKNITKKSVNTFVNKFKTLLRTKNQKQFNETYLELQFARGLCERVSPLAFEPLVPAITRQSEKKPSSPDYALKLPDGYVALEITYFHFGALDKWIEATTRLGVQLKRLLESRRISRSITIAFPLGFSSLSLLPGRFLNDLADEMSRAKQGRKAIAINGIEAATEWKSMAVKKGDGTISELKDGQFEPPIGFAFEFTKRIVKENNHNELFLRSLRNTLDRKHRQAYESLPNLVVLGLGHESIRAEGVKRALTQRMWPNPKYKWLTGVLIFIPARTFLENDPPPTLHYSFNPNATIAPTQKLIELLESNERFHLRDGKFCSE